MTLAQSMWATAGQTIPIAALTTVALGAILAPWIARRQEAGKAQASAEAALRKLLVEMRADVAYARAKLDAKSTYDPRQFTGRKLAAFTINAVAGARALPRRQQRKVRTALIELVGAWRVQLAEELGPALAREDPHETFGDFYDQEAVIKHFNMKAIAEASGDTEDVKGRSGYLGAMETSQLPHEDHPHALAALDRLLRVVAADAQLGRG
ncbi:hypothetical protein OG478_12360 [Streptomyces phaeochromogenes]|uniref:hypothetical protein n=1 Tax=Streptomyces phaeochromogenes TaxID=1923 RepID=UPI00386F35B8|nr:hypothetical protein OG478_12360 [Streptomyces phaeochromogenes]